MRMEEKGGEMGENYLKLNGRERGIVGN